MAGGSVIGALRVVLGADSAALEKGLKDARGSLDRFSKEISRGVSSQLEGLSSRFGMVGRAMAALGPVGLGAGAALGGVAAALTAAGIRAAESEKIAQRLEAVLRITGNAAGLTARQIDEFASSIERSTGTTADEVKSASAALATFTSIGGDEFKRVLAIANDAMAVYGGNLREWSDKIARALDDPVQGFAALKKQGFALTDSQLELVKAMLRVGDVAGAQRLVLGTLESQLGGAAASQSRGLSGAFTRATQAASRFFEEMFKWTGVGPAMGKVFDDMARGADRLSTAFGGDGIDQHITRIGEKIVEFDGKIKKLQEKAAGSAVFDALYGRYIESMKAQKASLEKQLAELNAVFGKEADERANVAASERSAKASAATDRVRESIAELDKALVGFESNSQKVVRFRAEYEKTMAEIAKSRDLGLIDPAILEEKAAKAKQLLDAQIAQTQKLIDKEAERAAKANAPLSDFLTGIEKRRAALSAEMQTIGLSTAAQETLRLKLEALAIAKEKNIAVDDKMLGKIEATAAGYGQLAQAVEEARSRWQFVEGQLGTVASGLTDIVMRTKTAAEAFREMATSIIRDFTQMIIKAQLYRMATAFMGGGIGAQSSYMMGNVSVPLIGSGLKIPEFAAGGSAIVGGSGGIDSKIAMLRVTPGERIDVSKSDAGGRGSVVIQQSNHWTNVSPDMKAYIDQRFAQLHASIMQAIPGAIQRQRAANPNFYGPA